MGKVICPGELLIDFICSDKTAFLMEGVNFIKMAGGAPANVAVAIKKMGAQAYMLGAVGDDQFGHYLEKTLKKYDVNTENLIKTTNANTTLAFVSLDSDGERDFKFNRGADAEYSFDMIDINVLENANVFHFGSATAFLDGDLRKTYFELLDYARSNEKWITFDPNYRDALFENDKENFIKSSKEFIGSAHIVKVSEEEARLITGEKKPENAALELNFLGAQYVLVTLGSKGALLSTADHQEFIPVEAVKMIDSTGAGDAFIGTIVACLANNDNLSLDTLKEYIVLANKAGAITVQKYGALESIPYLDEII